LTRFRRIQSDKPLSAIEKSRQSFISLRRNFMSMCGKTELQQQIFSILEEDLDRSTSEIAEELDCSESYVRKLKKQIFTRYIWRKRYTWVQYQDIFFFTPFDINI
jgi:DNA-binding CsgD family transcriptional regulator